MYRKGSNLTSLLRDEIELWGNVTAQELNELGQFPIEESKIKNVWAGITPQTGSLLSGRAAETTLSRTTHKITVRYDNEIMPSMWFIIDGQRYDILYILDPYLNRERLEIFCEVVV